MIRDIPQFRILAFGVATAAVLALAAGSTASRAPGLVGPSSELDPAAVVRTQLEALAHNDEPWPDAGIEATWAFASPENRSATGPLPRFRRLFENPVYGPMVDHVAARVSEARRLGEAALVGVVLDGADGRRRGYLFRLSRADRDGCEACWMTDSVLPVPVPQDRDGTGPAI
jgi:hypothetical protein